MSKEKVRKNEGITLIVLVITIIVLLILAGVSIAMLSGENGILKQVNVAKIETEIAKEKEQISLAVLATKSRRYEKGENNFKIEKKELNEELKRIEKQTEVIDNLDGTLTIYYLETERYYLLDEQGEIIDIGKENPVIVRIIPNSNKITKDVEGNISGNTQITGTELYIHFEIETKEGYTATITPSLPYKITQNGDYNFTVIATNEKGETRTIYHTVNVNNYIDKPKYGMKMDGNSHIEVKEEIINQNDFYQNYTIATKLKVNQEQQSKKDYMGIWGNHLNEKGIDLQFSGKSTLLFRNDYTPYYDKWTDIVLSYDSNTRRIKSYLNGKNGQYIDDIDILPYEGFNIGTSFLYGDRQFIGEITCLKIWKDCLTDEEISNMDLFQKEANVAVDKLYANINLTSEEDVKKVGKIIGTGYQFWKDE